MKAVVSLDEFRKNLSDIVGGVMYGNQVVFVEKHNKTGVVVISEKEYESLKDPRKRFASKAEWERFFIRADKVRERLSLADKEELEKVINEEVRAVRAVRSKQLA